MLSTHRFWTLDPNNIPCHILRLAYILFWFPSLLPLVRLKAALHLALDAGTTLKSQTLVVWVCMQAAATFEAALKRLKDAGVEIVEFDMGLLIAEGAEMEAQLLVAYEAPRELAR